MKTFLIKYQLVNGSPEDWHPHIAAFVAAVDNDPELHGRITYRCMKAREGSDYYHLATAADDDAVKMLQTREFFSRYTDQSDLVAAGGVEVVPLEIVAQTQPAS